MPTTVKPRKDLQNARDLCRRLQSQSCWLQRFIQGFSRSRVPGYCAPLWGWQHNNRGEAVSGGDTLGFRQQKQRHYESMGLAQLTTAPDFDETIQRMWEQELVWRQRERDKVREAAAGSFGEYADAARRRLYHHGFTEDFQLLEDPQQQDQRLTWIEYLEFEYWWLDRRTNSVGATQQQH
jgi:hypothetical protein